MKPYRWVLILLLGGSAWAQAAGDGGLVVKDAWVRGTVPGQTMTGAFMRLEAPAGAALVGVEVTPGVAAVAELHESRRDQDMARMQPVKRIAIAAGQAVDLKPGGYHVMLMDLKQPMREGDEVRLRLHFEEDGQRHAVEVVAPVRKVGATGAGHAAHGSAMPGGAMAGHGGKP